MNPADVYAKMFSFIRENGGKQGKTVGYFCEKTLFKAGGIW